MGAHAEALAAGRGAVARCWRRAGRLRRTGAAASAAPLGLPPLPVPADNPPTRAQDRRWAASCSSTAACRRNGTMSCAMCHVPEQGFTVNELPPRSASKAAACGATRPRCSTSPSRAACSTTAARPTLENQVWGPLLRGRRDGQCLRIGYVIARIRASADYAGLFEAAFAGAGVAGDASARPSPPTSASLVVGRFALRPLALRRRARRADAPGAARLRAVHRQGALRRLPPHRRATTRCSPTIGFHNTGVGWRAQPAGSSAATRCELAPGVVTQSRAQHAGDVFGGAARTTSDATRSPLDPQDRWAYRTPSLRNVALTAPYMHDGSLPTLEAVVEFYDRGGIDNPGKSPLLAPLGLSAGERRDLVAFLHSLTGGGIEALVAAARSAPPGQ